MRSGLLCLAGLALSWGAAAQQLTRANVAEALGFENSRAGQPPVFWAGSPEARVDDTVFHGGRQSASMQRSAASASTFSSIALSIPADFDGQTIEWRGFLKNADVSEAIAIWMRLDGPGGSVGFATSQGQQVKGTRDWTEYSITLPTSREARQLVAGFSSLSARARFGAMTSSCWWMAGRLPKRHLDR